MSAAFFRTLAKGAARRYDPRDRYARHFAYGKLTRDPAFRHMLATGLLPSGATVLDLGCGQGVLAALLAEAREAQAHAAWPADWSPPPERIAFRGIDVMPREVERAARAGGDAAHFACGDIRAADFGRADAVVILDVLHYIDYASQLDVLRRARDALGTAGVMLLRVADRSDALRFKCTLWIDRLAMALRGLRVGALHCRTLAEWTRQLEALGFTVAATPMSAGTPFANVLLVARYEARG